MPLPMVKTVTAADANRRFSEILQTVKKGGCFVVTSHGQPVAEIIPVREDDSSRESARSALFARLRKEKPLKVGRWNRDELYRECE